jgi:fluoride exporter
MGVSESTMTATALVAVGGAVGSVARYKLGSLVLATCPDWRFPLGTFVVNVLGCLVIGGLAALGERSSLISADARAFLFTGILGGFTTFSAFGLETFQLLKRGELLVAGSYVGLSVVVGLLALWLGVALAELAAR